MRAANFFSGAAQETFSYRSMRWLLLMRVGVELMMTNISVAKSSLLPSKITQGTWMVRASPGRSLVVEVEGRQPVLAVDDQVLALGLRQLADVLEALHGLEAAAARW